MFERNIRRSARRQVQHDIGASLDGFEKWLENLRRLSRVPVDGIACVQMDDGRARFGGLNGGPRTCSAVIGRYSDIDGVWTNPVIAQVTITLPFAFSFTFRYSHGIDLSTA